MTLPDREPLSLGDFTGPRYDAQGLRVLSGHPSTWAQEVEQLRNGLQAIIAATDMDQTKHRPEVIVQIVRHLARAALQQEGGE